jgi:hypothetical protein
VPRERRGLQKHLSLLRNEARWARGFGLGLRRDGHHAIPPAFASRPSTPRSPNPRRQSKRKSLTSVITTAAPRTFARDIVSCPFACQTPRFAPDSSSFARQTPRFAPHSSSFDRPITPMMKDTTAPMIVISAQMPLIIALLFHSTAVMQVISARMTLIIALIFHTIRLTTVTAARMIDITGATSITTRLTLLIVGMLSITKNELSVIIAMLTEPDRGAETPPIALG